MPRPRYNYDITPNETGYQSMFVPMDLGTVQQNLGQNQQRFDATAATLTDVKNKLNEMPGYNQQEKEAVVSEISNNFNDIWAKYNGNLAAASTDILKSIGEHRNNPYFQLNETALKQAEQRAGVEKSLQAQGRPILKFADMPTTLKDEQGNWRKADEFKFDYELQREYDAKRQEIWSKLLKPESLDTPASSIDFSGISTAYASIKKKSGIFQTQVDNKFDEAYNQYKTTEEYTQEKRKAIELEGIDPTKVDAILKARTKSVGESMKYTQEDWQNFQNPNYGKTGADAPLDISKLYRNVADAALGAAKGTSFSSDVWETAATTLTPAQQAVQQGISATLPKHMSIEADKIKAMMKKEGLNPEEFFTGNLITGVKTTFRENFWDSMKGMGPYGQTKGTINPLDGKSEELRDKIMQYRAWTKTYGERYIADKNYPSVHFKNLDPMFVKAQWEETYNKQMPTEEFNRLKSHRDELKKSFEATAKGNVTVLAGWGDDKADTDLKQTAEFWKLVNTGDAQFIGFGNSLDRPTVMYKLTDGREVILGFNNSMVASEFAETTQDPIFKDAARNANVKFIPGSTKYSNNGNLIDLPSITEADGTKTNFTIKQYQTDSGELVNSIESGIPGKELTVGTIYEQLQQQNPAGAAKFLDAQLQYFSQSEFPIRDGSTIKYRQPDYTLIQNMPVRALVKGDMLYYISLLNQQ
jgi:hypothetical protein